jgi:hypothetical protein
VCSASLPQPSNAAANFHLEIGHVLQPVVEAEAIGGGGGVHRRHEDAPDLIAFGHRDAGSRTHMLELAANAKPAAFRIRAWKRSCRSWSAGTRRGRTNLRHRPG